MKKILFVCLHNSGRSQMAEALFNHYAAGRAHAFSAGTRPASHIDRAVIEAMIEVGIDIRSQKPKPLTSQMLENADLVITMGCSVEEICLIKHVPAEDWALDDPEGKSIENVKGIRDEIKSRVKVLVKELE